MEYHEIANLFPMMEGKELNSLALDISVNGLIEPIILHNGKILDGRNRYRACQDVKIEPRFENYEGETPLQFVISKNLQRRHLDESQRAMVAARIANMKRGRPEKVQICPLISQEKASELMNVSERSVKSAGKVIEQGSDELIQAVNSGEIAVSVAAQIVKEPPETQSKIIENVKNGDKPAKAIRKARKEKDEEIIRAQQPSLLATGKYKTIVIDPPWQHHANIYGRSIVEYATMPVEEIAKLKIADVSDNDCHLYLWTTNSFLLEALTLLKLWGFDQKTCLTWVKPSIGMGYYFRNTTEHCLFAVKGSLALRESDIPTHFEAPRGGHSEKPQAFFDIVERASYPPYLEIFGRKERQGWEVRGNL